MIVADTNLLIYLYVRGQRTVQAEAAVVRDHGWVAPLLWRSEFRNVLAGLVHKKAVLLDDAIQMVLEAEQWMAGREYAVLSEHVMRLATRSGCSAYDCEYVALAQDLGIPLVTADKQVLAAFPSTALSLEQFVR